mmetsp:Transcript_2195/g.7942  ORF Transcript_2195/g.7942 Transcript_2195/m.7942 type:complete len:85 (-) Transcript_2195:832-1086(-)
MPFAEAKLPPRLISTWGAPATWGMSEVVSEEPEIIDIAVVEDWEDEQAGEPSSGNLSPPPSEMNNAVPPVTPHKPPAAKRQRTK